MKKPVKVLVLGLALVMLLLADLSPQPPFRLGLVREAAAIIGLPFTPLSFAGVARRTTRRALYMDSLAAADANAAAATTAAATTATASAPPPPPTSSGSVPLGTVVHALPAGCVATPINGIEYYNCAPGVYYRAAFQGNNLVYVSAKP